MGPKVKTWHFIPISLTFNIYQTFYIFYIISYIHIFFRFRYPQYKFLMTEDNLRLPSRYKNLLIFGYYYHVTKKIINISVNWRWIFGGRLFSTCILNAKYLFLSKMYSAFINTIILVNVLQAWKIWSIWWRSWRQNIFKANRRTCKVSIIYR